MATIKVELRRKINQDGTYPLAIRITKNRKNSYIHLGQSLELKYWDAIHQCVKKSHPNSARLNNFILKKLAEGNDKLLELEAPNNNSSARVISKSLKSKNGVSFFAQAKIYLGNLKSSGKHNSLSAERPRIERFREFMKGSDITFQEITVSMLNQFAAWIKGTRKVSDRTVINHLVVIRSVFSQAIKAELVDQRFYPFGRNKIQIKFPQSSKVGLSIENVKALETAKFPKRPALDHARNIWLFSFYFAGMRISDVLRLNWMDFQDNRMHYVMGKNTKSGSLKIPETAQRILDLYQPQKRHQEDLVFPELKILKNLDDKFEVQRVIKNAVKKFDTALDSIRKLVGIDKDLTLHIARHTFGNLSGDKINPIMLQKLYRHSSISTTIGYQANFIHKDADDALDAVLGF